MKLDISFRRRTRVFCRSCGASTTTDHHSGIPLGWQWWLDAEAFTCADCNGVTIDEKRQIATINRQ